MKLAVTATPRPVPFGPIVLQGDLDAAFALAAELGYDGVEVHLRHPDEVDRGAIVAMAAKHAIEIPTLGTGFAAMEDGLKFASPDPEIRRRAVARVREHISLAKGLHSAVTIGALSGNAGSDPCERSVRRRAALTCLEECCEAAAASGVTLLLEPINRYECDYVNTLADAMDIVRQVGAPTLKVLADTFHMNIEEANIAESLREAGSLLGHVHLVDSNRQAPGHGHLDVREILRVLTDMDYQGFISFEVLPRPTPRDAAADAISCVRGILNDLGAPSAQRAKPRGEHGDNRRPYGR